MKKELAESTATLKNSFEAEAFDRLNKSTMLSLLIIFNRKRIGEVQYFLMEDFKRREKIREDSEVYNSLYESEKLLAKNFYHVNVKGKWHTPVPVLINKKMSKAIDFILKLRGIAGVHNSNPYLFGKGSQGYYNASHAMREAAFECKAKYPQNLTGTQLRKHVATVAQALDLSEGDLRDISGFLGHTVQTHLTHYRMPSDAVHAAKISRLLLALDWKDFPI